MFKPKRLLIILILIVLVYGGYRYWRSKNQPQYDTETIQQGDLSQELVLSGELAAHEHTVLQFQSSGRLAWVGVKEGDLVDKYQAIAGLDQRELQKTLQKKLNLYVKERWDFEQERYDYRDNVLDDELRRILDKGQKDLDNTVIDVEIQDLAVKYATLTTPISGVVIRVSNAQPGTNIVYTTTQFEVVNPETIYFKVSADQTEVVKLYSQQAVKIVLDAFPDEHLSGIIDRIAFTPQTGETGTVYEVSVDFQDLDNRQLLYRLGMTGDATFVTDKKTDVLYAPLQYIKSDDQGEYLLVNNPENKVYIQTGIETDEDAEIISDQIKAGDVIYNLKS